MRKTSEWGWTMQKPLKLNIFTVMYSLYFGKFLPKWKKQQTRHWGFTHQGTSHISHQTGSLKNPLLKSAETVSVSRRVTPRKLTWQCDNHHLLWEMHGQLVVLWCFHLSCYSNWELDGTVPTYWFWRTLTILPFGICAIYFDLKVGCWEAIWIYPPHRMLVPWRYQKLKI